MLSPVPDSHPALSLLLLNLMRAFSLLAALALFSLTAIPASAQQNRSTQRLSPTLNSPVVPRTNAGEARRVTNANRGLRSTRRVTPRAQRLRSSRVRRINTRRVRIATPRLRTVRAPEGRFVRRNGSYFRVTPSRLRR